MNRNRPSSASPEKQTRLSSASPGKETTSASPIKQTRPSSASPDKQIRPSSASADKLPRPSSSSPDKLPRPSSAIPVKQTRRSSLILDKQIRRSSVSRAQPNRRSTASQQSRPSTASRDRMSRPSTTSQQSRPSTTSQQSRPSTTSQQSRPSTASQQSRPSTASRDQLTRPSSVGRDQLSRPSLSRDQQTRPTSVGRELISISEIDKNFYEMVHLIVVASKPDLPKILYKTSIVDALKTFHRTVHEGSLPEVVMCAILAAMPFLLCHSEENVVVKSTELLGAIALSSYQSALIIFNDHMTLRFLLKHLRIKSSRILIIETCHTVSNIATTSSGQSTLCSLRATEMLMYLLFRVAESAGEDEVIFGIIDAIACLTQDTLFQSIEKVPLRQRYSFLRKLQKLWQRFRNYDPLSNEIRIHLLCKLIFLIGMDGEEIETSKQEHEKLLHSFLGEITTDYEHFWKKHWECLPSLISEGGDGDETRKNLLANLHVTEQGSFILNHFLRKTLSCPPCTADELEALRVYEEVVEKLGKPLVFGQDIRLVQSVYGNEDNKEYDYENLEGKTCNADLETCVKAFQSGYSIAIRGMQFRSSKVSALAESLAIYFGQATVGANLYMTPRNAQGFKPHFDDHCVFVWQLIGSKAWKIWSSESQLPRLYTQNDRLKQNYQTKKDAWRVILQEGNILYIPRGFPHVASTKEKTEMNVSSFSFCKECSQMKSQQSQQSAFALHITFGVEVEPPFDWEGFIHMSLHCWAEHHNWEDIIVRKPASMDVSQLRVDQLSKLYTGLLHVALRCCSDKYSMFRKACFIAAKPFGQRNDHQSNFRMLVGTFFQSADFKETLNLILATITDASGEISLDWMHWLRHLYNGQEGDFWIEPVKFFRSSLIISDVKKMELEFIRAKDSFVSHARFAEACDVFINLLGKYRAIRKKYLNGIMALQV